jgi:8-oxo-dGTP diphosphatase
MIKVAVGIIIQNGHSIGSNVNRVLLCQRKKSARYGLKWEFPGGKLEAGETPEDCLRRELREELSISAEIGQLFHQQHYVYPDSGMFDVFYYKVNAFTGTIVNHVFESFEWTPIVKLLEYDILDGNRDVVAKLLKEYA